MEDKSVTCKWPGCITRLARDNQESVFCSIHQKQDYQRIYELEQQAAKNNETAKATTETLAESKADSGPMRRAGVTHILLRDIHVFRSCSVIEREGDRLIATGGSEGDWTISLSTEAELFINFAGLDATEADYLDFACRFGLLGLQYWMDKAPFPPWSWADNEEPVVLINYFQRDFQKAFEAATDYIANGWNNQNLWLAGWFTKAFKNLGVTFSFRPPEGLELSHTTLMGALVLQLYRYVTTGQVLRECELHRVAPTARPECTVKTTRTKYCSDGCANLYRQWKMRKKIKLEDGQWRLATRRERKKE